MYRYIKAKLEVDWAGRAPLDYAVSNLIDFNGYNYLAPYVF